MVITISGVVKKFEGVIIYRKPPGIIGGFDFSSLLNRTYLILQDDLKVDLKRLQSCHSHCSVENATINIENRLEFCKNYTKRIAYHNVSCPYNPEDYSMIVLEAIGFIVVLFIIRALAQYFKKNLYV